MKGGLEQHQSPIQPIAKPSSEAARGLVASGCCKHEQLSANGEEELFALKKTAYQAPSRAQGSNRESDSEKRSERGSIRDDDDDAITSQQQLGTVFAAAELKEIHPCASPLHTTSSDGEEDSKLQPSVEGTSNGDGEHDRIPDNHADPSMVRAWTPHVMNEGNQWVRDLIELHSSRLQVQWCIHCQTRVLVIEYCITKPYLYLHVYEYTPTSNRATPRGRGRCWRALRTL